MALPMVIWTYPDEPSAPPLAQGADRPDHGAQPSAWTAATVSAGSPGATTVMFGNNRMTPMSSKA